MHHTGGPGWRITLDTSGTMLLALYLRDAAGLHGAGDPAVSPAEPKVRLIDPRQAVARAGGVEALRIEWACWWEGLAAGKPSAVTVLDPPGFLAFTGSPALQRFCQAHFGAALSWGRERKVEYTRLEAARQITGEPRLLGQLVEEREMELGRNARSFTLNIIELPLLELRAWYIEPGRLIMSKHLLDDEDALRSFLQPIIELLV